MVYRKDPKKRSHWLNYLAYLVVASLVLTGVSMSRYQVSVSGSDTARAAVVTVGNSFSLQIGQGLKPGKTVDMPFTVSNQDRANQKNEVLMEYTLELEHSLNLPLEYTLYALPAGVTDVSAGGQKLTEGATDQNDLRRVINYTETYELHSYSGAAAAQNFVLRLVWPAGETAARYSDEIDYTTIRVNAVQRDG